MQVRARLNNLRIAPRKVRLSVDLVRGLETNQAVNQLDNIVKRSNEPLKKLILSAIANAENNFGLDKNNLKIASILVNEGPVLKRWMPRAFGRASMILKRTSRIDLVLEEIEEGKNRKTKEEIEKDRKKKIEVKKEAEKEIKDSEETEEEKDKINKNDPEIKQLARGGRKKKTGNKGWAKKMFNRKSM